MLFRRRLMMNQQENEEWDVIWTPDKGLPEDMGFEKVVNIGSIILKENAITITSSYNSINGYYLPQKISKRAILEVDVSSDGGGGFGYYVTLGNGLKNMMVLVNGTSMTHHYGSILGTLEENRNLIRVEFDENGGNNLFVNGTASNNFTENNLDMFDNGNGIFVRGNLSADFYSIKAKFL